MEYAAEIKELLGLYEEAMNEYAESDAVAAARTLAQELGLDPARYTPDYWQFNFPHTFDPREASLDELRGRVPEPDREYSKGWVTSISRPETDEEIIARIGGRPPARCRVYRCGRPQDDPIHIAQKDLEKTG